MTLFINHTNITLNIEITFFSVLLLFSETNKETIQTSAGAQKPCPDGLYKKDGQVKGRLKITNRQFLLHYSRTRPYVQLPQTYLRQFT